MPLPQDMAALHQALHIQRVVIVTPSVYGTENAATLYGMQARGADARGVEVIDDQTPESALDAMGQAGVRGIRLNLATAGITDLLELVRSGKAYVKISAAYRVGQQAPDYADVVPLAQALITAN